jgi:spore maturation protein CgeB
MRSAVVATEFWHGANGRSLAQGLRGLGWAVDEIDMSHYLPRGEDLVSRLSSRVLQPFQVRAYNAAILESAARHQAEMMLTVKGGFIAAGTLAALRARGVRTVNYYPDVEFEHAGMNRDLLAAYDVIATTKSFHLPYLHEALGDGSYALVHHGFSPLAHRIVHAPRDEDDYRYDVLYAGNASPYKFRWLLGVAEALPGLRMAVIGHRWSDLARGTALERFVQGTYFVGDYYAELIGASRINIALHSGPVTTPGWEDAVSTRTFEIPACGGFMLHIDNPEVRTLFDVPAEIDTFSTPAGLVEKIGYYLAHPAERRAIAERGHARAVPAYAMDARAAEIVALL